MKLFKLLCILFVFGLGLMSFTVQNDALTHEGDDSGKSCYDNLKTGSDVLERWCLDCRQKRVEYGSLSNKCGTT